MKKAIIIHGVDGSPTDHWYQREKNELEKLGYTVFVPQMPNPPWPKKEEWINKIMEFDLDEDSVLLGFSLGGTAVLRFLERFNGKVDTVVLMAALIEDIGYDNLRSFLGDFKFDLIKGKANKFVVINQDKDPKIHLKQGHKLSKELGVDPILVEGNNHFLSPDLDLELINRNL